MKKILLFGFVAMVLVQWYVPVSMIFSKEKVLSEGTVYRFKAAPVDPNDPFRGKYLTLNFADNRVKVDSAETWNEGEKVLVQLGLDEESYAYPLALYREAPDELTDLLQARISYIVRGQNPMEVVLEYPFERYYLEEGKAPAAEKAYFEALRDTLHSSYASVKVLQGDAVLEDLVINGISIQQVVGGE